MRADKGKTQSFRSALELLKLMDGAVEADTGAAVGKE